MDSADSMLIITGQAYAAAIEICEKAKLRAGQILVVGCSTSEVAGETIGSASNADIARAVFRGIANACREHGVYLAAQCCEHLNRALVIEQEAAHSYEICNAVPRSHAGGAFAACAYDAFTAPVLVEAIKAEAGLDIGYTMIGMHLKKVAVPVRLENNAVGRTVVLAARTRAKYIGGERAVYDESLG